MTDSKPKRAVLTRQPSTDQGTFGSLVLSDGQELCTVELPWRDNAGGRSCIPLGVYRCEVVNSPRFGRAYEVRDVVGRSHILIHAANFGGDVDRGWDSNLLGCIGPGLKIGMLQNRNGQTQKAVISSRDALARIHAWASMLPFELEIR